MPTVERPMTSIKTALTVILKAGDVVVAEKEDAALWQQVLAAINNGGQLSSSTVLPELSPQGPPNPNGGGLTANGGDTNSPMLAKFAAEIGVAIEQLQAACDPVLSEPYIHLDVHKWEAMKKLLPVRGRGALSNIVVAATVLALWFRTAQLGNATQALAQGVLANIGASDANPSRGIQSASWLQTRAGGTVLLNPAEITKAKKLLQCFVTGDWTAWKVE